MLIVWGSFKGELGKKECDGVSEGGGGGVHTQMHTIFLWQVISNVKKGTSCRGLIWSKFKRIVIKIQII